jgi:hypothetical protein
VSTLGNKHRAFDKLVLVQIFIYNKKKILKTLFFPQNLKLNFFNQFVSICGTNLWEELDLVAELIDFNQQETFKI